jgi:hypothetical protein
MRNGLAVRSKEQAKNVPKIFPTNEFFFFFGEKGEWEST